MCIRDSPFGMAISMSGLFTLAFATNYAMLLLGGTLLGVGSSIFHPETSRLARLASGGSHGLAQSIFQVGGNFGSSLGPLLMIFLILPNGQHSLASVSYTHLDVYKRQQPSSPRTRRSRPDKSARSPLRKSRC